LFFGLITRFCGFAVLNYLFMFCILGFVVRILNRSRGYLLGLGVGLGEGLGDLGIVEFRFPRTWGLRTNRAWGPRKSGLGVGPGDPGD
jgi:hypothetical protein